MLHILLTALLAVGVRFTAARDLKKFAAPEWKGPPVELQQPDLLGSSARAARGPRGPRGLRGLAGSQGQRLLDQLRRTTELLQPRACVFMLGLPAAGKSTVIEERYGHLRRQGLMTVVDLDQEITAHPWFDPKDPDAVYHRRGAYTWAEARTEERFTNALQDPSLRRVIVDGTGTKQERQIRRMQAARDAGFFVKVIYVRVPVQEAITRARFRKRNVAQERIEEYQAKMERAFHATRDHADEVEIVDYTATAGKGGLSHYVDERKWALRRDYVVDSGRRRS